MKELKQRIMENGIDYALIGDITTPTWSYQRTKNHIMANMVVCD